MVLDDHKIKSLSLWRKALIFGAVYVFCAEAGDYLSPHGGVFITFWLPGGLYLAVLLLNRTRDWPWFALAGFAANVIFDYFYGTKFVVILAFFCANTIQAVTGAWLVRRFVAETPTLSTLKEFTGLAGFAAIFSAMLGAVIGAWTVLHFDFSRSFEQSWEVWWGSNAMAIMLLTPFILTWFSKQNGARTEFATPKKIAEAAALLLALIIYIWLLFFLGHGIMSMNRTWAIPLLLWAGLRFGVRGATAASLLLSLAVAFFTTQYAIGLNGVQISTGEYIFPMQAVLAMASLVALIPAIVISERNKTLAELRVSEERFKNLSAAAFEGIAISENGRVLDMNDQGLKMFGYKRSEMIGKQIVELIAPEWRALVSEAIRTGRETIYGHQLVRKDGSVFFAEAQAKMVRVDEKNVRMTALRDITERKRAEEALRNSEALFRSYFELAMVGCVISSLEKGIFAVNEKFCQMLGYPGEELKKMTWVQLTHPDDVAADVAQFNRVLAGEIDSYLMDKRYIRKDGREVFVTLSVRCVRHPDGSPDYFVGLVMDISESRRAQKALQENQRMLTTLLSNLPGMAYRCQNNLDWTMEFVSEGSRELTGYMPEDFLNNKKVSYGQITHPGDNLYVWDAIQSALRERRQFELTYRIRTADGSEKWVWERGRGIFSDNGDLIALEGFITDITSKRQAELEHAKAVQREQMARAEYTFQLIASQEAERMRIARELHDGLGQNLLLIKNRAQLEMTKTKLPDAAREEFQSISNLALQSIAEVRQISRDLHPHQLDLLGLTRALRALIENADESSAIAISGKFDAVDEIFLRESATNVYRIVQESLNNILKHSRAKNARILLERDVHEVQLKIEDDGCGFKTDKDGDGRKGLGLKNIAERVRMLGGKMKLDSQPEKGTRIEITIPISAEHG